MVLHRSVMIMAASAAMIFIGYGSRALAQDGAAPPPQASSSLMLVNQIQAMQAQMRQMQGQIEELQHALKQLQQSGKDQYLDLDSRVARLEQARPATSASSAPPVDTTSAASAAVPAAPATAAAPSPMSAADQAAAETAYEAALKTLRDGDYVGSARGFRAFIDQYPQSSLVPNAYYWLGGSYYVTQNYKPALEAFQALLRDFPGSSKAAETQLRVADCQAALKDYAAARRTLQATIEANRGTPLEQRARDRLQDLPAATGGQ